MSQTFLERPTTSFLFANILILATVVYAAILASQFPDFYYLSIQEDEYIEWASFWAFMLASFAALVAARRYRADTSRTPWFLYGLAFFCCLVAMEEISWGQRFLGYRPPVYFLEHNFQQELNFHNVIETNYRKLALSLAIAGYGIVLPLLALTQPVKVFMERLGIVVPPLGLTPAFVATFLLYLVYPFSHSGEWVELMFGVGMLFAFLPLKLRPVLTAWLIVMALGLASGAITRLQPDENPAAIAAAQAETEAIIRDFESGRAGSRCNLHKRLYTFVVKYKQHGLQNGEFASLAGQGLPQERVEFFLDPWNSPYWIRDRCIQETKKRVFFVYSFGPNRRRDSTVTEIRGDDIGTFINIP